MTTQQSVNNPLFIFFQFVIFMTLIAAIMATMIIIGYIIHTQIIPLEVTTLSVTSVIALSVGIAATIQIIFKKQVESVAQKLADEFLSW